MKYRLPDVSIKLEANNADADANADADTDAVIIVRPIDDIVSNRVGYAHPIDSR